MSTLTLVLLNSTELSTPIHECIGLQAQLGGDEGWETKLVLPGFSSSILTVHLAMFMT